MITGTEKGKRITAVHISPNVRLKFFFYLLSLPTQYICEAKVTTVLHVQNTVVGCSVASYLHFVKMLPWSHTEIEHLGFFFFFLCIVLLLSAAPWDNSAWLNGSCCQCNNSPQSVDFTIWLRFMSLSKCWASAHWRLRTFSPLSVYNIMFSAVASLKVNVQRRVCNKTPALRCKYPGTKSVIGNINIRTHLDLSSERCPLSIRRLDFPRFLIFHIYNPIIWISHKNKNKKTQVWNTYIYLLYWSNNIEKMFLFLSFNSINHN